MASRPQQRRPSMVDVAREAGVAHVTVSRVINSPASVTPETRDRVNAAIAKLGYRRNDLARTLKSGRSMTLGVVIAGSELFELPRILLGVETAAQAAGYWVNLASWQAGNQARLLEMVDRLVAQGVQGVAIIADRPAAASIIDSMDVTIPVSVVMSGDVANPRVGSIELDQRLGARLATRHLLDLGHRDIVHLTGRLSAYDASARLEGFVQEMAASGIPEPRHIEGDFTAASGHRLGLELMTGTSVPSAVFAGNDHMAMGLLSAAAATGVSVPGDLSVVGFDDIAGAEFLIPPMTTVRQDFVSLGQRSVEVLVGLIEGEEPRHHLIPPALIVRGSSAAWRTRSSSRAPA